MKSTFAEPTTRIDGVIELKDWSDDREQYQSPTTSFYTFDPLGMRIDDESTGAKETDQGDPHRPGGFDRERRRRAHRGEYWYAGDRGFLNQLERGAPTDQEYRR